MVAYHSTCSECQYFTELSDPNERMGLCHVDLPPKCGEPYDQENYFTHPDWSCVLGEEKG